MSTLGLVATLCAVALGGCLQGSIGFGMGTVAAPVVAMFDPALLPSLTVFLALVLTVAICVRERTAIDFHGVSVAFAGRLVGTALGAVSAAELSARWLGLLVGVVVLVGMGLNVLGWRPAPTRRNVAVAGAASGLFGTATSIGGPPMALVWRGGENPRTRGTMAAFFLVGSAVSLVALAVAGKIDFHVASSAVRILPALAVGFVLSERLSSLLTANQIRWIGITVSVAGAVAVIVTKLAGP